MKIDDNFIDKIFNLEIKIIKEKDKIKLSKYDNKIPMYDIRSERVYAINKKNLYNNLILLNYRFINEEIYHWQLNLFKKYKNINEKAIRYKSNINIIENYNLETLIDTSYKTLYKYSTQLGLNISICKRNSYNKYLDHLNPYYSKLELIKLGQNMNLIKQNITLEDLLNREIHHNICLKISHNDVSFKELEEHHKYIYDNNLLSWICFYSFTGAFIFNSYLREGSYINEILYTGLMKIVKLIENSPKLNDNLNIYRFIWDDSYLSNLKLGDIFIDKGFMSTTRDPFYTPGFLGHFGLILIKINLPKDIKGIGIFIENFSLFSKEEELLLPPYTKLKLISRDDNFKYYHINEKFEKLINKKYEFNLIGVDYKQFYKDQNNKKNIYLEKEYDYFNLDNEIKGFDRIQQIKNFIKFYSTGNIITFSIDNEKYKFFYQWFNSSEKSVYEKFYFNKTNYGLCLSIFDNLENGYPYLNIELGEEIFVNYLNKFYFGSTVHNKNFFKIIYNIGKIFNYKKILISHEFSSFIIFKNLYENTSEIYLSSKFFNKTIYNYLKNGKKFFDGEYPKNIYYNIGYWYLDNFFNKNISIDNLPIELIEYKTNKDLFINVIEKHFYYYDKIISLLDNNIFENEFFNYNIDIEDEVYKNKNDNNLIYRDSILKKN